jgi:hypothetical protein
MSDGCGGQIRCGECSGETACGPDHTCHSVVGGCGLQGNTIDCFGAHNKPRQDNQPTCSECVLASGCLDHALGGGACEDLTGTLPHFGGTLADGRACNAPTGAGSAVFDAAGETETQICLQALGEIFSSQCAATDQLVPCFCGPTQADHCLNCSEAPVGPLLDLYVCDMNTTSCPSLLDSFTDPSSGVGRANALAICAGNNACDCF